MKVKCHSCARVWEVIDPDGWEDTSRAQCGYCGRSHTLAECLESQVKGEPKVTKAQWTVLETLWDVAQNEKQPITLKRRFHSSATALVRRGLVEKFDNFPYRPTYQITLKGLEFYTGINREGA